MSTFRFVGTAVLSLLLGSSVAVFAQEDRHDEARPQQEEPRPEPRNNPRKDEARPPQQDEARPRQDQARPPQRDETRPNRQEQRQEPRSREQARPESQGREQQAHGRPAGKSAHIPDDRFRANFGRQHTFVINRPVIVEGQPQFVYGGYTFVFVDPWPAEWAYTDDCYIDYVDGDYFLYDLLHPGVRIALFVVM